MKHNPLPTPEIVRNSLVYCEKTGVFTWRNTLSNSAVKGKKAGSIGAHGYIRIGINNTAYPAHRLAWLYVYGQDPRDQEIDHIDRNKHNNAISNLRLVNRKQNNENIPTPRNNTTGVRGVSFDPVGNRWVAYIYHHRRRVHLGSFKCVNLASEARKIAESKLFAHSGITGEKND